MSKESELKSNKAILYRIHGFEKRPKGKSVHHIVFKSEGGGDNFDNLSLLDNDFHRWIHKLIQNMDRLALK